MDRECVLNELSIDDVNARQHNVLALVEQLAALPRLVGTAGISLWHEVLDKNAAGGQGLQRLRAAGGALRLADHDQWRRAFRLFTGAQPFVDELAEEVQLGPAGAGGDAPVPGRGLGRAHRMNGLALSLNSANRWLKPWIDVHVISFQDGSPELHTREVRVRHASEAQHVREHSDNNWPPLADVDRLRVELETSRTTHVAASKYCSGKHVKGTTNEERQERAARPAGLGQYFAEHDGRRVNDDVIRGWEKKALSLVQSGMPCTVKRHGGAYHVYCDLGEDVGYLGDTGKATSCVRVEWSMGSVHSHPRLPRA